MRRAKQVLTDGRTARATIGKRNASAAYCWRKWRLTVTVAGFGWTTAQSSIQAQHCSSEQPYMSIDGLTRVTQSTPEMTSCRKVSINYTAARYSEEPRTRRT